MLFKYGVVTDKQKFEILLSTVGPFGTCRHVINLTALTEVCEYDLCVSLPDTSHLCEHLEHLASACSKADIIISDWRQYVNSCCKFFPPELTFYKLN